MTPVGNSALADALAVLDNDREPAVDDRAARHQWGVRRDIRMALYGREMDWHVDACNVLGQAIALRTIAGVGL